MASVPRIILVSNSPGEVSTFVRPVAAALQRSHPDWIRQVALVPCPYATGAESSVIAAWPEVSSVWSPTQTAWQWLRGRPAERGVVCFLGGDPWHALLLKRRFGLPAVAYFSEPTSWRGTDFLGGFERTALGFREVDGSQGEGFIGDLRVDAVRGRIAQISESSRSHQRQPSATTLALFPGSRWLHLKAALGPFLYVVDRLHAQNPDCRFLISVSPFVTPRQLADAAAKPFSLGLASSTGSIEGEFLRTAGGASLELIWGDPYRAIEQCDLALSLPGTNTAELAIAGKPTVVPLSDRVPVGGSGLLGLLDRLPGMESLKSYLKQRKLRRLRLIALPNQLAGRVVMPEFLVRDDLEDLFDFVSQLLDNAAERQRIGDDARSVMGPPGAAQRFVEMVEATLDQT